MKAKDLNRPKLRSKQIIILKYVNFINISKLNLKITHYLPLYWLSLRVLQENMWREKRIQKYF
jgi:hypothetical protein